MINRRSFLGASLGASAVFAAGLPRASLANTPFKIIVPYPAGSGSDIIVRAIASELPARLDQPVVVANNTGAAGYVATFQTYTAPPDGNSILMTSSNHVLLAATKKDLQFDVVEDFAPVTQLCSGPLVVTVNPTFPAKTMADVIAMAKKDPEGIKYASSGYGSAPHLATELFSVMAGIKMVHVPYRGGAPAAADVIAGVLPMYFGSLATSLPFFESKQAVAMAQTPKKRPSFVPDIPTIAEQTGLDYDVNYWYGILAPPKTPAARIAELNKHINEIALMPKISDFIAKQGFGVQPNTPAQFKTALKDETALWLKTAKAANIKPE